MADKNISDLTGIESFTALTFSSCSDNNLKSLDLSSNVNLTDLYSHVNQLSSLNCRSNKLPDLDVNPNSALTFLNCSSNEISSLDISGLVNIEQLFLQQNQLTTVNLPSSGSSLWKLEINENQMTDIDVSLFGNLRDLGVHQNQITSLNLKNGNNSNFASFNSEYNPNLTCIFVDDSGWSNDNWSAYKYAPSTFVTHQLIVGT
ncbi:hypothetical protein ACFFVB_16090 [Formosa undariae]|uniref:Leucine-rich repeat domain-containing protein n=1 Tax=Formosa undariae TaxID=1325436 RepID=A0ABV5F582_9FLAO